LSRLAAHFAIGIAVIAALSYTLQAQGIAPSAMTDQATTPVTGGGWSPHLSVDGHIGTPGLGADGNILLFSHLGVRAGFNALGFNLSPTVKGVKLDGNLHLETFPILADLYPWGNGSFHLTGGLVINKNSLSATGQPSSSGTYSFNGNSYDSSQVGVISAKVSWSTSGYAGLGWGTPAMKGRVSFITDLGVIIGSPTFSLTSTNPTNNPTLAADIAQQQATSQKSVSQFARFYPVINLGIAVRVL
jgi:hypothetical protein